MADQNGQDSGSNYSGIHFDDSFRCYARKNYLGANGYVTESTQFRGIGVTDATTVDLELVDNYVHAVKTGGYAYGLANSTDYGVLRRYSNNKCNDAILNKYAGINLLPIAYDTDPGTGLPFRTLVGLDTNIPPSAGTFHRHDILRYTDPLTATPMGLVCGTAGTFSTATDNTGDTDGSTGVITGMSDTSDFFVGEYVTCSAGFASTGPHMILAKTSTTITVNVNSNSAQSNITVSTPNPAFLSMPVYA